MAGDLLEQPVLAELDPVGGEWCSLSMDVRLPAST
jgi:hypothetical protein